MTNNVRYIDTRDVVRAVNRFYKVVSVQNSTTSYNFDLNAFIRGLRGNRSVVYRQIDLVAVRDAVRRASGRYSVSVTDNLVVYVGTNTQRSRA